MLRNKSEYMSFDTVSVVQYVLMSCFFNVIFCYGGSNLSQGLNFIL